MFMNDKVIFRFTGPMRVRVEIGQSLGFLLLFMIVLSGGNVIHGLTSAAMMLIAIFSHEMGHAWGCIVQGVPVRRIMLHGGGGFCEHAISPTRRKQELIVAMGPLVNLALWALSSLAIWPVTVFAFWILGNGGNNGLTDLLFRLSDYLWIFAFLNFMFFIFNIIPVQPLDGGKLFHLTALRFYGQDKAQRVTGSVGLFLSILWIPAMIYAYVTYGWLLFFIPSIPAHLRMARGQLS